MPYLFRSPAKVVFSHNELGDCPERGVSTACMRNLETHECQETSEWVTTWFNDEHTKHGLDLTGLNWSYGPEQGDGAGLSVDVDDLSAYLAWRCDDRNIIRRLLWLNRNGDVSLSFVAVGGHYNGTRRNLEAIESCWPTKGLRTAIEWLEADAELCARELESWIMEKIMVDIDEVGSVNRLKCDLEANNAGIDEYGNFYSLSECEKKE